MDWGLGFTDVRQMNICLLCKLIHRLVTGEGSLVCNLFRKKYLGDKSIFQLKSRKGSQFWTGVLDVWEYYSRGRRMVVSSGKQTRYWEDTWLDDCPLKVRFYELYNICSKS